MKRSFEILWVFFQKISVFYFNWPESWIWRTLGHVSDIFCKCHIFIMLQKKSFGQKDFWISCTGWKVPFWQFFNSGNQNISAAEGRTYLFISLHKSKVMMLITTTTMNPIWTANGWWLVNLEKSSNWPSPHSILNKIKMTPLVSDQPICHLLINM